MLDCSDNATINGVVHPIDGVDLWPRFLNNGSDPAAGAAEWAHEFLPTTGSGIIFREQWKLLVGAGSTHWYTQNDSTVAEDPKEWPCGGSGPPGPPAPPAPPPSPAPPCALQGWDCLAASFCGPTESYYWAGDATLAACEAKCLTNASCTCFDHKTSPDAAQGDMAPCRLHAVPLALRTSSIYTAYWKPKPTEWVDRREHEDVAKVSALAAFEDWQQHSTDVLRARAGNCNVCTGAKPCLFDLFADPGEHVNLAAKNPQMVAMLKDKLATYKSYVGTPMDPAVLAKDYICEKDLRPWYGNFSGPCCIPKPKQ